MGTRGHHRSGRLPAPPAARPHDHRGDRRHRRRQGHPHGGRLRRGHHHPGRRGGPRWRCAPLGVRTPTRCWFSTVAPAYVDKTNATAIHAALRLPADVPARRRRRRGALGVGALRAAARRRRPDAWWSAADIRTGLPGRPDEAAGGDGAAALLVGDERRRPGARRAHRRAARPPRSSSTAGAPRATPARSSGRSASARPATCRSGQAAWDAALKAAGLERRPGRPRRRSPAPTPGPTRSLAKKLGVGRPAVVDDLAAHRRQRRRGPARPAAGRGARGGRRPARSSPWWCWPTAPTCSLFRTTDAVAASVAGPPVAAQVAAGAPDRLRHVPALARPAHRRAAPPPRAGPPVGVGRRPAARTGSSASSAPRPTTGAVHLPPPRRRRIDDMAPCPMADVPARSSPPPSTAWPTRPARPSCSRSSTSTAAAGCRSSSPTSTPTEVAHRRPGRDDLPPAVHRRRHPQLLLEGPAERRGARRD